MKIKRALAILLCISLILISVAGCRGADDDEVYENGTEPPPVNTPEPSYSSDDPLEEAERILGLLTEQIGSDNFIEFFSEMMFEYSEDPGSFSSPEGYLFREGDMVSEFYEAAIGLEIGEISGIVETTFGYHIILRVPINVDSVPSEFSRTSHPPTLRQLAAMEDFRVRRSQWVDSMMQDIEYSPDYESLDLAIVFENGIGFEDSFPSFAPDTVMITSGDISITWAHLYVFLYSIVHNVFERYEDAGLEVEWHEEDIEEETLAELVLEDAVLDAISFFSNLYGMQENNIVFSEEELLIFDEVTESIIGDIIEEYSSIEEFEAASRESRGYYNFDVFMDLLTIDFSVTVIVGALYGDDGSDYPDELALQYAETNNFLMAMHILRMKPVS
jgi:hypothetical protein